MRYFKLLAIIIILIIGFMVAVWVYNRYRNTEDNVVPSTVSQEESGSVSAPVEGTNVGDIAYDFTLTSFDNEEVSLSDYRGMVVVINFWGSWCGTCLNELPAFQTIHDEIVQAGAEADTVILSVNMLKETLVPYEDIKSFLVKYEYTFTVLSDNIGLYNTYHVTSVPQTIIIDKDGIISEIIFGFTDKKTIRAAIEGART